MRWAPEENEIILSIKHDSVKRKTYYCSSSIKSNNIHAKMTYFPLGVPLNFRAV